MRQPSWKKPLVLLGRSQQFHRVHRGWAMAVEATGRDELPEPAELQHQQSNDSNAVKADALRVARCCKPRDEIHGVLHTGEIRIRYVISDPSRQQSSEDLEMVSRIAFGAQSRAEHTKETSLYIYVERLC